MTQKHVKKIHPEYSEDSLNVFKQKEGSFDLSRIQKPALESPYKVAYLLSKTRNHTKLE
jgi:hypothetical protein